VKNYLSYLYSPLSSKSFYYLYININN